MGAIGGICLFDHERFQREIVPALLAGPDSPLVAESAAGLSCRRKRAVDLSPLASIATALTADLRSWRGHPPWPDHGWDDVQEIFQSLVTAHCVLGFSVGGLRIRDLGTDVFDAEWSEGADGGYRCGDRSPHAWQPMALEALDLLDSGSTIWAPGDGGYGEGIRGWLDRDDTEELTLALPELIGPDRRPKLDDAVRRDFTDTYRSWNEHEVERRLGRLTWFAGMLARALERGCGLLWGRDLDLFYDAVGGPGRALRPGEVAPPVRY